METYEKTKKNTTSENPNNINVFQAYGGYKDYDKDTFYLPRQDLPDVKKTPVNQALSVFQHQFYQRFTNISGESDLLNIIPE